MEWEKTGRYQSVMGKISSIYDAIRSCSINPDELSDPFKANDIPWPSPLDPPSRFDRSNEDATIPEGNVKKFQYMGRAMFKEVQGRATSNVFETYPKLYLYGPSGVRKSHLLAALVFCLVQCGERVVYIPDCRAIISNPFRPIQAALLFAFYGDDTMFKTIAAIRNLDDLKDIMDGQIERTLYFIIDQWNALDSEEGEASSQNKIKIRDTLEAMGAQQKYIFSASANAQSDRYADQKQSGTELITFYPGMTKVCPHFFELPCLTFPRTRQTPGSNATHPGSPKHTARLSRT
jgi:hypothetical protein